MSAMNGNASEFRIPVNGGVLSQFLGKKVTIFGTVIETDKNGSSFDIKTTDKILVTVALRKPLMEPISGLVEVHGLVKGKNSIVCDYYMHFPLELADTFDPEVANSTVSLIHSIANVWKDSGKEVTA